MPDHAIRHTEPCGCQFRQVTTVGDEWQGQSWEQVAWCGKHPRQEPAMTDRQQQAFQSGYQAALADLETALDQGGEATAREWIATNRKTEETP